MTTVAHEPAMTGMTGTLSVLSAAAQHVYSAADLTHFLADRSLVSDADMSLLAEQVESLHRAVQHEVYLREYSANIGSFLTAPIDAVHEAMDRHRDTSDTDPAQSSTEDAAEPHGDTDTAQPAAESDDGDTADESDAEPEPGGGEPDATA